MKKIVKLVSLVLVAVMCVAVFASCAPASDPDKAEAALKDAGYTAAKDTTLVPAAMKLTTGVNVDAVVTGTKTADGKTDHVTIVYFADKADAKTAYEKLTDTANEDKEKDDTDWVFKQAGNIVYWGTSAAVKAAR